MKKICFLSSDARPLYKRDVFRTFSYPNNFVIHFRYKSEYIEGDYKLMKGKEGLIAFTVGNDLSQEENSRNLQHISVREVIIQEVCKYEDTGLIHFYLRLKDFKKYSINHSNTPAGKFVYELELNNGTDVNWHELINTIKDSFKNELFYKFKIIKKDDAREVEVQYDEVDKQSYYELTDENDYNLEVAFCDTEESSSDNYHSLKIRSQNEQMLSVSAPDLIKIEARKDNRIFSVFTKNISTSSSFTYLNFETVKETTDSNHQKVVFPQIDTVLKIKVKKNWKRVALFAFWTLCAAFSLAYGKIISDNINIDGVFSLNLTIHLIVASVIGLISASQLYKFFDKK